MESPVGFFEVPVGTLQEHAADDDEENKNNESMQNTIAKSICTPQHKIGKSLNKEPGTRREKTDSRLTVHFHDRP